MGEAASPLLSWTHRAWRRLPARPRRLLLHGATALLAPRAGAAPPLPMAGMAVAGELSRASGLGEGARLMLRALECEGIPCWPIDIGPLLPAHRADLAAPPFAMPPPGAALVLHVNPPLLPLVLLRLPRALTRGRLVIGYWAWELPTLPPDWRGGGHFVHAVWVPSRFTAAAVEKLLPGRVRVVPHAVARVAAEASDQHLVSPSNRPPPSVGGGTVTVLVSANLASSFERKNPLGAVAAFQAAFGDRRDRRLILKLGNPDHFPADFTRLAARVAGAPNIELITETLGAAETAALTRSADIVLSLHRSEGFGLVLAEAMLLRKPVVATGWSGNMDFMDPTCSVPVPFRLIPVADPRGVYAVSGAMWADPDLDAAATALRRLADDPAGRAVLGERAARAAARLDARPLADAVRALGHGPPA